MNNRKSDFLYLIWKDPQTRRNFTVGKLTRNEKYFFKYCEENSLAKKCGWRELEAFPEEKTYESETLFPVFSSRLPDPKRRDIKKILEKYDLFTYDEYELLRKSSARLPIDTYEFIDPIFPEDSQIQRDFYVMGIRYSSSCSGIDCSSLPSTFIGDRLKFSPEPENKHDPWAIRVLTQHDEHLGYVPRYYNRAILNRLKMNTSYSCVVLEVNTDENCSECIKVRLNMPSIFEE